MRKDPLVNNQIYHICTKSIAGYQIFNNKDEFQKMLQLVKYYQFSSGLRFSYFFKLRIVEKEGFHNALKILSRDKSSLVQIIAYCLMPTHIHLILRQIEENGISEYMKALLDAYTKFFNTTHERKGPLWESRFKNVLVKTDEQLIHLTRYLHLNAVTAHLVERPEDWVFSSYQEYLGNIKDNSAMCIFNNVLEINPAVYKKFVNDRIDYQRELRKIKKMILD